MGDFVTEVNREEEIAVYDVGDLLDGSSEEVRKAELVHVGIKHLLPKEYHLNQGEHQEEHVDLQNLLLEVEFGFFSVVLVEQETSLVGVLPHAKDKSLSLSLDDGGSRNEDAGRLDFITLLLLHSDFVERNGLSGEVRLVDQTSSLKNDHVHIYLPFL